MLLYRQLAAATHACVGAPSLPSSTVFHCFPLSPLVPPRWGSLGMCGTAADNAPWLLHPAHAGHGSDPGQQQQQQQQQQLLGVGDEQVRASRPSVLIVPLPRLVSAAVCTTGFKRCSCGEIGKAVAGALADPSYIGAVYYLGWGREGSGVERSGVGERWGCAGRKPESLARARCGAGQADEGMLGGAAGNGVGVQRRGGNFWSPEERSSFLEAFQVSDSAGGEDATMHAGVPRTCLGTPRVGGGYVRTSEQVSPNGLLCPIRCPRTTGTPRQPGVRGRCKRPATGVGMRDARRPFGGVRMPLPEACQVPALDAACVVARLGWASLAALRLRPRLRLRAAVLRRLSAVRSVPVPACRSTAGTGIGWRMRCPPRPAPRSRPFTRITRQGAAMWPPHTHACMHA